MRLVLSNRRIWAFTILGGIFATVLALAYFGAFADPEERLDVVPVVAVNLDAGAGDQNFGAAVVDGIEQLPADAPGEWSVVGGLDEAEELLANQDAYAAVVIPESFSADLLALADPQNTARPAIQILTNPGAGAMASNSSEQIATGAVGQISAQIGADLAQAAGDPNALDPVVVADPIQPVSEPFSAPGDNTALGMASFYFGLVLMICGFLITNISNLGIDNQLGYMPEDLGPKRVIHDPAVASRRSVLLGKMAVMTVASLVMSTALVATAVVGLDMAVDNVAALWWFTTFGIWVTSMIMLALTNVVGTPALLLGLLFLFVLGVPSSGGIYPHELMPGVFQVLGEFLPMRAVVDGARSIFFYDAALDTGLGRALLTLGLWGAGALALGLAGTSAFDRRGLHRYPVPDPESARTGEPAVMASAK